MVVTAFSSLQYLPFILLSMLTILSIAQNDQRINLGSSITASDSSFSSWQSPSGEFAFGFRQIDDQNFFLLAIWFDKIPDKTIVWYANGNNPAPRGSKIELTNDGQFTLNNPQGQSLWEADISSKADYALLLNTGNFVLGSYNSSYIWESFDYPADTLLPSQVLDVGGVLFSRETNRNYSKGRFQLRMVPEGDVVLETIALPTDFSYGSYYSTKTSADLNRMNSGYKLVFNETGYLYVLIRNGTRANLTSGNIGSTREFYYRATLNSDGIFALYAHAKSPQVGSNWVESWFSVWYVPEDICFAMTGDYGRGACGFNSFCALDSDGRPTCECLPGFLLVDPSNRYSGCKQDKVQKCEGSKLDEVYDMSSVSNAFWPSSSNYERFPLRNEEECSTSCLSDCNCVVVVIKDGYCWKKKLPLSNGRFERNTYGKVIVKIPKIDGSEGDRVTRNQDSGKKNQETLVLIVSLLLGGSMLVNLLFIGGILLVFFFVYQKKQNFGRDSSLLETNLKFFTYEELKEATGGFKEEVGRGAFGTRENEEEIILTDWVYDCYKSRRIEKVVEDDDEARTDMKRVERLVMVAIWCIQEDPSLRPSMKKVLQMLEGVVEVSIPPCPSPYTSIC
ncbi:hypothetical protein LguiB_023910 [Lonicera macranthoides]